MFVRKNRAILIAMLIGFVAGATAASYFLLKHGDLIGLQQANQETYLPREIPIVVTPAQKSTQASPQSQPAQTQSQPQTQEATDTPLQPDPEEIAQIGPAEQTAPNSEDRIRVTPHALKASGHGEMMEAPRPERIVKPPVIISKPSILSDSVSELRERKLVLPVKGLKKSDLRDSFNAKRSNHVHEAIDILAPRNTPVLAVDDGTIGRLWTSPAGGITVYQFDPHKKYEYYYAHLERYADGLKEGDKIDRGDVIGYVGTTGNAPKNTPHLHFTIFHLTDEKHWWEGTPINPYLVLK